MMLAVPLEREPKHRLKVINSLRQLFSYLPFMFYTSIIFDINILSGLFNS